MVLIQVHYTCSANDSTLKLSRARKETRAMAELRIVIHDFVAQGPKCSPSILER
jgi:hypothetical protein